MLGEEERREEHRELSGFLRREAEAIARLAAHKSTAMLPVGGPRMRRRLGRLVAGQITELARLLDLYPERASRMYGELLREHAAMRLAQGLDVREAVEEESHLLHATIEVWTDRRGLMPPHFLQLLSSVFGEAAAQIADVWVTYLKAEGAGFEEAALLETIVHHLDEAIVVAEADGSVTFATPSLYRVLGVPPRNLVGLGNEDWAEVLRDLHATLADAEPFDAEQFPLRVALRTGRTVRVEGLHVRRPGGDEAILEVYAAPVYDEDETLRGAIATFRDRTEQARSIEALEKANAELRRLHARLLGRSRLEAVGELAHGAAHALNNQLNVLSLRVRRLAEIPAAAEEAHAVERSAREIAHIVARLQEFAAARPSSRARPIDLVAVLQDALALTRAAFGARAPIPIEADLQETGPVMADPDRLLETVASILLGARDTTVPGSAIRLEARREGRHALVRVIGGGPLPLVEGEKLFDPTAPVVPEQALSLSGIRETVASWGGGVEIRSVEEDLVAFEVRLRSARERPPAEGVEQEEAPAPKAPGKVMKRILVVDDDRDNAAVLSELLEESGARTGTAATGTEALEVAASLEPEAALVDLLLPDMDGWEVARRLRERNPDLKVAVVSGTRAEDQPEAESVDAVFRKPVEPRKILAFLGL